jgi:hypothetical protein
VYLELIPALKGEAFILFFVMTPYPCVNTILHLCYHTLHVRVLHTHSHTLVHVHTYHHLHHHRHAKHHGRIHHHSIPREHHCTPSDYNLYANCITIVILSINCYNLYIILYCWYIEWCIRLCLGISITCYNRWMIVAVLLCLILMVSSY